MKSCNTYFWIVAFSIFIFINKQNIFYAAGDKFMIGYLTGSQRRPGDMGYSRPGLSISGAISLAVEEIKTMYPLYGNHQLDFTVQETYGDETESILKTALLWTRNVSVYLGPQETCIHEARMAASFNLPMISYFCAHYETSDKQLYPTFSRTRPPDTQISKSVASVLKAFNWYKIAFLYSETSEHDFAKEAKTIIQTVESQNIEIKYLGTWKHTYYHGFGENPFDALVKTSYQKARIYVVLGYYYEHLGLMISLQEHRLLENGEYFVLGIDIEQYDTSNPRRYLKGLLKEEIEESAEKAFQSYIGIVGSPPMNYENFTYEVNKRAELPPFNHSNPADSVGGLKKVPSEGAYLYDAVYVYARALNSCLENGENPYDGRAMFKYIQGQTYRSAMGYMVYIDEKGDAEGNYTLIARKPFNSTLNEYGLYPVGVFQLSENNSDFPTLKLVKSIEWVNNQPPADEPACGFNNEKCVMWKLCLGIAGGVALGLIIIALVIYRYWSYEQELDSLIWKIDYRDIQINEYTPTVTQGKANRSFHPLIRTSQVSLSSNPDADFRYSTIYTQIGVYRGRVFAIKRIRRKSMDITRKMKKELKTMRDLRHDNLNPFIGACVDSPNICVITEYCSRGSLKDILENEDVKLDNMFIASLIQDIIRGMIYLHESTIRCHAKLKSTNCLVDSRWVLKICDFGLHQLNDESINMTSDLEKQYEKLLWTAPEILRDPAAFRCGTQKGDVYSFAIILYETVGRSGPYGKIEMTASEIISRVMRQEEHIPIFRPQIEVLDCPLDCIKECIKECWSEDPDDRLDFKAIRAKLRPMRKGMKPNIFDNMLVMMEKYANNLEALVDERTDQLVEEKKKTEALLYEMLPKYVAEQLKRGNKVEAESFDYVTIYFSDIVGFTKMSAESSPLQIVDFLNDLYTCFDSIIENYDVYKVETIGDAYMVVSGLPIRNGDQHAGEIASMALHLLEAVKKFKIRHKADETLKLRIGLHSGPVCAGVVGLKMPRYCLFGDTVNTASRMESTGVPLKIHCSLAFKEILDKLGNYKLTDRGVINIKGKGPMKTYWLVGETQSRQMKKHSLPDYLENNNPNCNKSTEELLSKNDHRMFESSKLLRFLKHKEKGKQQSRNNSYDSNIYRNSCPSLDIDEICENTEQYRKISKLKDRKLSYPVSSELRTLPKAPKDISKIDYEEIMKQNGWFNRNPQYMSQKCLFPSESEPFLSHYLK